MSWHRLWHQREDNTRSEAPSSKLRRAMRQQMREDARRVIVTPKVGKERTPPREIDEPPEARIRPRRIPPAKLVSHLPPDIHMPKGWYLA